MAKAGDFRKGDCIFWKSAPYLISEREFVNPGKGSAFVRLKLKNLKDGSVLKETMKTNDNIDAADVYDKSVQYLFTDDHSYHFMDNENFDQFEIPIEGMEEKAPYLKDSESYKVVFYETQAIDIILPLKMAFIAEDCPDAVKGNTATGATKIVTTETGLKVNCPIFLKQGEKIMVNTETGEYVERINS